MHSRYTELSVEDSGLTALGWEQTNLVATWLAQHEKIDVLISAPQLRSRLTAQRIGQATGLPVTVDQELPQQPRILGASGLVKGDPVQKFPPLHVQEQFPSGQQYANFSQRLVTALERLMQEHRNKTLAIVMDGNGVATALRYFLGAPNISVAVNHTSISEVSWHNSQWCLIAANRMEHNPQPSMARAEPATDVPSPADAKALNDELSLIAQVYNRVLNSPASLNDQARDQRLRHLLKFAMLPAGLRILDVGTGNGRLALMLAEDGAREVVGVDISPAMLEMAEYLRISSGSPSAQRVSYRLAAAQRIPFRSDVFDAVICRLVLHHIHKPEEVLRELARLLRPGGILILSDLLAADDSVKRATQNTIEARRNPSHVAALSADQYRKLVVNAGLTLEADAVAVFERELEDWLNDLQSDPNSRNMVREMIEAGLETDATGFKVRRQGGKLIFDQRMFYLKAIKR